MDIDRLRKLSGLNEKRPGDRGFTPGVQEPEDRLKNDRGFIPGEPEPGYEPGNRGFIPGAPQVPPMPTPDKPNPKPSPGGPRPDRPKPQPKIPSPGGPPVPKPDPRPGIDFPGPSKEPSKPVIMGIAPPEGFDSWNDYYADPRPDSIKRGPMPGGAKTPSLRDYLKNIRRS